MTTVIISNVGNDEAGFDHATNIIGALQFMVEQAGTDFAKGVEFLYSPGVNGGEITVATDYKPTNIWKDIMQKAAKKSLELCLASQ